MKVSHAVSHAMPSNYAYISTQNKYGWINQNTIVTPPYQPKNLGKPEDLPRTLSPQPPTYPAYVCHTANTPNVLPPIYQQRPPAPIRPEPTTSGQQTLAILDKDIIAIENLQEKLGRLGPSNTNKELQQYIRKAVNAYNNAHVPIHASIKKLQLSNDGRSRSLSTSVGVMDKASFEQRAEEMGKIPGITFDSTTGLLSIDKQKLMKAIRNNPIKIRNDMLEITKKLQQGTAYELKWLTEAAGNVKNSLPTRQTQAALKQYQDAQRL